VTRLREAGRVYGYRYYKLALVIGMRWTMFNGSSGKKRIIDSDRMNSRIT